MNRKLIAAILLVVVIIGALAGIKTLQIQKLKAMSAKAAPPPEYVSSVKARNETWQRTLFAIGSIMPAQGVTLTPDIPGTVREIAFESGAPVARGDLLVRLDTSSEDAQLRAIEAQAELARINRERARTLRKDNMISQSELDSAEAAVKQEQANAEVIKATIAKKTIRAPFSGRTGIRQVNLGQYVEAGKPIVSIQSLSPVFVDFMLPQQDLALLTNGLPVRLETDTYPGRQFDGTITAINPDLDTATRSVKVQATLANQEQLLRPGMFARVEVLLPGEQSVLVVLATSVLSAPYGDSVFVIEPSTNSAGGLVVRQQPVRTGRTRGDYVSVEVGLKAGQRVVSSGLFKLRNGVSVIENNTLAPKTSETPRPSNS